MTTETSLQVTNDYMPVMDVRSAIARRNVLIDFVKQVMVDGTDYGKVPGTEKNTLLKAGAEKLDTLFGLTPIPELIESITDWTGAQHNGEQFFYFAYRYHLRRNGVTVAAGDGSCNSMEKKYRYRQAERKCPNCGKSTIIKGKVEFGGGWICFAKKGGCGAKYADDDKRITEQSTGQVINPDIADLVNTIQKMAQKRALVAATLLAVNASEFFTQDVEDMEPIEAEYKVIQTPKQESYKQPSEPTQPPPPPPGETTGNGHTEPESPKGDPTTRLKTHKTEAIELIGLLSQANHETEARILDNVVKQANIALERKSSASSMHSIATMLKSKIEEYTALLPQESQA